MGPGRMENVEPGAIAVPYLEPELPGDTDHLGIIVDGCDRVAAREQRLADNLAEPAKANQQRGAAHIMGGFDAGGIDLSFGHQPVVDDDKERRHQHRHDDDGCEHGAAFRRDDADRERGGIKDEGKLAALRHQDRALDSFAVARLERAGDAVDTGRLEQGEGGDADDDDLPVGDDHIEIKRHADGEKEEPEEDAPEGFDVSFQLVPVRGFRQEHAGEEGAHGGGKPAELHPPGRAQHEQQGGRRHHFARAGRSKNAEHRIEQIAARKDEAENAAKADSDALQALHEGDVPAPGREERDQRQQRHNGEILKQQNRHHLLAARLGKVAPLLKHLHDDGGGGEDKARARNQRGLGRIAERDPYPGEEQHADANLDEAEPENVLAHRPEP